MPANAGHIAEAYKLPYAHAQRVEEVARDLGMPDPAILANLIWWESRFKLNNPNKVTGANGLIQFIPPTLKGLGFTPAELAQMSFDDQMDLVYTYLKPYKGKITTPLKAYMAVFRPKSMNEAPDTRFPESVIKSNNGIDTPAEYARRLEKEAKISYDRTYTDLPRAAKDTYPPPPEPVDRHPAVASPTPGELEQRESARWMRPTTWAFLLGNVIVLGFSVHYLWKTRNRDSARLKLSA